MLRERLGLQARLWQGRHSVTVPLSLSSSSSSRSISLLVDTDELPSSIIPARCTDSDLPRSTASSASQSDHEKASSGSSAPPNSQIRLILPNLRAYTSLPSCTKRESTTSSFRYAPSSLGSSPTRCTERAFLQDEEYAAELLARASELQYAPSAYKLGECYEYGKMGCPQDSALSIHYYSSPIFLM
jgi:hypothetical protein